MPKIKQKILIVHKYLGFIGGIERYIYETGKLLRDNGYELYGLFEEELTSTSESFKNIFKDLAILSDKNRTEEINKFASLGIKEAFIHKVSDYTLFPELQNKFTTTMFIHDHDYYCMRGHKYYSFNRKNCHRPYNTLFCTACNRPFYRNETGNVRFKAFNPLKHTMLLKKCKNCDRFVVLSDHMKENLIINKFKKYKIHKIYPVIQCNNLPESNTENSNKILCIGQVIRGKGIDLLLKALTKIKANWELNIVGKGNDENFIKGLIKEYKLEKRVSLIGFTLNIEHWYNSSAMVVVPSRWQEPFGLIGPEAFSHGKPVIGFNVGGINEWLKNKINGYLIPAENTDLMAKKIEYLLGNPAKAKSMGINGFKFTQEQFNKNAYLNNISKMLGDSNV